MAEATEGHIIFAGVLALGLEGIVPEDFKSLYVEGCGDLALAEEQGLQPAGSSFRGRENSEGAYLIAASCWSNGVNRPNSPMIMPRSLCSKGTLGSNRCTA